MNEREGPVGNKGGDQGVGNKRGGSYSREKGESECIIYMDENSKEQSNKCDFFKVTFKSRSWKSRSGESSGRVLHGERMGCVFKKEPVQWGMKRGGG